ncbi:MAG: PilZ domain-containing protein [Acidobacteriota bacterium]
MRVLLFNLPGSLSSVRRGLLARAPFLVEDVSETGDLRERIESTCYGMVILSQPSVELQFTEILASIRSENTPCAKCILILLAPEAQMEEYRQFLGNGLNVLLPLSASPNELEAAIARRTMVAPRVNARIQVRVEVRVQGMEETLSCQTVNISRSGMLLESTARPPIGAPIVFELPLPGMTGPLTGEGWVVRHTTAEREKLNGIGVAFISLSHGGRHVLARFIDETLAATDQGAGCPTGTTCT